MITEFIQSSKYVFMLAAVFAPLLCAVLLKLFSGKMPRDQGREFAVDGEKSAGKIRGAGILFICSFIVTALLFVDIRDISVEFAGYYVFIFLAMLSGYLDDRSETPWNEYKKGAIDLVISVGTSVLFTLKNPGLLSFSIFGYSHSINKFVFMAIGTVLVWMLINAVNCSDGIDGFSSTLSTVSFISLAAAIFIRGGDSRIIDLTAIMILTLFPYLWNNSQPSTMMMGDAGSRALGLFMALLVMKTGNILLVVPLCFMVCLDGLLGIAKVSIRRFLKVRNFMEKIRTPLHDHCRKNKGWSNTQVIYRFCMIQIVISLITLFGMK